ncbi:uncharacterized protein K02A2.6-like [Uranotaenia lowii]|uniref:uncharacterized protein K02A2.6-like n=1 Tax=Uranotaenia lowii TaxID=190385 RepID=UPI002479ED79|nr:uncharacterized protein K02A2.6-like [Uranotaenia lowii]
MNTGIWPQGLKKFECHKNNLHHVGSLISKDERIVLPSALRQKALASAHSGHVGEAAMKRILREYFWWPGMATEAIKYVKSCNTCTMLARKNPPIPLSNREMPNEPWEILQIDFLSLPRVGSGEFLIAIDTYSRYLSVAEMRKTDAETTNLALMEIFKPWGLPKIVQSDNGPPFQSSLFCKFWEEKGVRIRKSIPLSPQSNGAVERQNQGLIKAVSAARIDGRNWKSALNEYVHRHNTVVPHSRLLVTPFELMVGRKYRGVFPCLWNERHNKELDRIDVRERDAETKLVSKKYADSIRGAKESQITVGDFVKVAVQKKTKTDPNFSADRYQVAARQGAKVAVMNKNGVLYSRNVQDVKKIISDDDTSESEDHISEPTHVEAPVEEPVQGDEVEKPNPKKFNLRDRENLSRSSRFNDTFLYSVDD